MYLVTECYQLFLLILLRTILSSIACSASRLQLPFDVRTDQGYNWQIHRLTDWRQSDPLILEAVVAGSHRLTCRLDISAPWGEWLAWLLV